jgi:hypothetical protein
MPKQIDTTVAGWCLIAAIYTTIGMYGLSNGQNFWGFLSLGLIVVLFSAILLKRHPVFSIKLRARQALTGTICIFLPYFVGGIANLVRPGFGGNPWADQKAVVYNGLACFLMDITHTSVCLALNRSHQRVFFSYSHKDLHWLELILNHLGPYLPPEKVTTWADVRIRAGSNWEKEINRAIYAARATVLLVSPDFLSSEYIKAVELPAILGHRDPTILWLPIRSVAFEDTLLRPFQAVLDPRRPLADLPPADLEEALERIAKAISKVFGVDQSRLSPASSLPPDLSKP